MTTTTVERQLSSSEVFFRHIADLSRTQVIDSESYQYRRQKGVTHPEAFRQTAFETANDPENNLSDADRSLLSLVGNLGVFVQATAEVESISDRSADEDRLLYEDERHERKQLRDEYLIPFNHGLKEFVNTHPNEELRGVSTALANAYSKLFSDYNCLHPELEPYDSITPNAAIELIQTNLDGMRHEVAAQTLLEAADYSYNSQVSVRDDAKGVDMFVYLDSGWEAVDIKSTQAATKRAIDRHRDSRAVFTGLLWEDFTGQKGTARGTLSIPFEVAERKAGAFVDNIYAMVQRNKIAQQEAARKSGKRALNSYS